jgi:hypothetical protein
MMKDFLKKCWGWFGKKLIVTLVGLVLASLKAQHPDWPLPSEDLVKDLVLAFLAAHTLTDVVAVIKTAVPEVVKDVVGEMTKKDE